MISLIDTALRLYPQLSKQHLQVQYGKKGKTKYEWGILSSKEVGIVKMTIYVTGKEDREELLDVLSHEIFLLTGLDKALVKETLME